MKTAGRLIAIGDIHGCSLALQALLDAIQPRLDDTIVTLGDYVDVGIDSKGVLDQLIELEGRCHLMPLRGNHEELMLRARLSQADFEVWNHIGGIATLDSYGDTGQLDQVPAPHFEFLERCRDDFETDSHFFIHANYYPNRRLAEQDSRTRFWLSLDDQLPGRHFSGKTAIVGHTPQPEGQILNLGYLMCLDTGCGYGGLLTAMEVRSGKIWQADERGQLAE